MTKGKFIVFEGIDGTGKSTLIRSLAEHFRSKPILTTKSPCKEVPFINYESLQGSIENGNCEVDKCETCKEWNVAELLALLADRVLHTMVINRALDAGTSVLCDRFNDSTYAYQGRTIKRSVIHALMLISGARKLVPDLTILLTAAPEVAYERILNRSRDANGRITHKRNIEKNKKDIARLRAIQDAYLEEIKEGEFRGEEREIVIINTTNMTPSDVLTRAITILENELSFPGNNK